MTTDTAGPAGAAPSDWNRLRAIAPAPRAPEQVHELEFTGSGSEYFRIWIVNLLLTLVTLGLYHPWAKVRKLRYFYGNTSLAGHAFDFHGDPKRMLRGYLLVGSLFGLYFLAGQVSPIAGLIALAIIAAIWPALLRAAQRFRLAQTSWRGLRFAFIGDTAGAYKALLPGFLAALVFVAAMTLVAPDPESEPAARVPAWAGAAIVVAMLLFYAALPYTFWLLKRYQHDHYQYASVRTRFTAGPGSFYLLSLKAFGLLFGAAAVFGILMALVGFGAAGGKPSFGRVVVIGLLMIVLYAAILFTLQPFITARLQNLVWSRTESRSIGIDSELRFWPLVRLTALNWLLVVCTLGLYWPFAAVATARMRLAAVSVTMRTDLDALVARGGRATQDASGDAAADLFGVDIGL